MIQIQSRLFEKFDTAIICEFAYCINDLIHHEVVRSMQNYMQHGCVDCLAHSLFVSFAAYRLCKKLGLDYRSAARGGLLHDFFLYDWHLKDSTRRLHGFLHPKTALQNADRYFSLNTLEREIIRKHMWPLTVIPPIHIETYIVLMIDKYYSLMETAGFMGKAISLWPIDEEKKFYEESELCTLRL